MRSIDELKEQLEALESLSMSQLSLDMPKAAPSLLRGIMELLDANQKEIADLKDKVSYHEGVLKGIQNSEMQNWEERWRRDYVNSRKPPQGW